jgi:putative hydrolase of the HAD superfamily
MIGLDGDDTLWESETHFVTTTEKMTSLLSEWVNSESAVERLVKVERRNLATLGYGVKAFALSMIETAIEVSEGEVDAATIHQIIGWAKELMDHPVEVIHGVPESVATLAERWPVILVTKGDLLHQESKFARSGLEEYFSGVHIVSEKDRHTYARILAEHGMAPGDFVMVGNSLRSDVLPVVELGGRGIHIPHDFTWALEHVEDSDIPDSVTVLRSLGEVAPLLDSALI